MASLVSIGIPVHKRLKYLPQALASIREQDYPNIELIVSDNGRNGYRLRKIVEEHYPGPYKYRQNAVPVSGAAHFNQMIAEASGSYFILLCDDDEISHGYVSELVAILEHQPTACVAISKQEVIDESGRRIRSCANNLPTTLSDEDFIQAWCTGKYGFECFVTNVARTRELKRCGGFVDFPCGVHSENALLVKLCLGREVAFGREAVFRWRLYEGSQGMMAGYREMAKAGREFLRFLDVDEDVRYFAERYPDRWNKMRSYLTEMVWKSYYYRWKGMYMERLSSLEWAKAAFAMPLVPGYYVAVGRTLLQAVRGGALSRGKIWFPKTHRLYRFFKEKIASE